MYDLKLKLKYRALYGRLRKYPGGLGLAITIYPLVRLLLKRPKSLPSPDEARKILNDFHPDRGHSSVLPTERPIVKPGCDVTVIMPVYNMELYLEEAVESVLKQVTDFTFKLIIVDDGSTDSSPAILQKYADDPRVTILHKPNGGLSSARNYGMEHMDGEYLLLFDSDDILEPGAIQALMDKARATDADLVQGGFRRFDGDNTLYRIDQAECDDVALNDLPGCPLTTLIRTSLFSRICFPLNYWYEDVIFETLVFPMARRIATIPQLVHSYRFTPGSITRSGYVKRQLESLYGGITVFKDARALGLLEMMPQYYAEYFFYLVQTTYHRTIGLDYEILKATFVLWRELYDSVPEINGITYSGA